MTSLEPVNGTSPSGVDNITLPEMDAPGESSKFIPLTLDPEGTQTGIASTN